MNPSARNGRHARQACWAVIPAAGGGSRMGADRPKQYLPLAGKTVIRHVLERFGRHPLIAGIVVALAPNDEYWEDLARNRDKPVVAVKGGAERHLSVLNALHRLKDMAEPRDWVLVHDAARPCLRASDLDRLIDLVLDHPVGGLLAVPVADTLKRVDEQGNVVLGTLSRERVWRALTPQMFRLGELTGAIERAASEGVCVTDEAGAMEHAGFRPRIVEGSPDNIKVTTPADLALADLFLRRQMQEER
jgi:2-C-methyl-D-erythritol 4-phosphate cytidylyltransferase